MEAEPVRDHVDRDVLGAERLHVDQRQRLPFLGHDVGMDAHSDAIVCQRDNGSFSNAWMAVEAYLDFAQLDTEPTLLDHPVLSTEVAKIAVRLVANNVAGPVIFLALHLDEAPL